MDVEISLTKHQMEIMESPTPITIGIMGRAAGKSYVIGFKIATLLLQGYNVIGLAQNYKATKQVLFKAVSDALRSLGVEFELNKSDMTIKVGESTLYGFSAEAGESIRGLTNIKALVIDEACLCPKATFDIAVACLRGQGVPLVYLISTPRGKANWVAKMTEDTKNSTVYATSYDNPFLPKEYVTLLEAQYSEEFAKQELLGQITDFEGEDQFFKTSLINSAKKEIETISDWKITIGVDCARFGNDATCIVVRHGKKLLDIEKAYKTNTYDIVALVEKYEKKYGKDNIASIAIDVTGGYGAGPYDFLKTSRSNVIACNFSDTSPNEFCNRFRTYIYQLALDYFECGGTINDAELEEELLAQEYVINNGKKQLKDKAIIKQKLGRSPDTSDAFCLSLVTKGDMFIKELRLSEQFKINYKLATSNRIRQATRWVNDRE